MRLDAFDRKILAILQKDNTTPQRTIGDAVNLSHRPSSGGSSA